VPQTLSGKSERRRKCPRIELRQPVTAGELREEGLANEPTGHSSAFSTDVPAEASEISSLREEQLVLHPTLTPSTGEE
jgi:hypothetical protein